MEERTIHLEEHNQALKIQVTYQENMHITYKKRWETQSEQLTCQEATIDSLFEIKQKTVAANDALRKKQKVIQKQINAIKLDLKCGVCDDVVPDRCVFQG